MPGGGGAPAGTGAAGTGPAAPRGTPRGGRRRRGAGGRPSGARAGAAGGAPLAAGSPAIARAIACEPPAGDPRRHWRAAVEAGDAEPIVAQDDGVEEFQQLDLKGAVGRGVAVLRDPHPGRDETAEGREADELELHRAGPWGIPVRPYTGDHRVRATAIAARQIVQERVVV